MTSPHDATLARLNAYILDLEAQIDGLKARVLAVERQRDRREAVVKVRKETTGDKQRADAAV